MRLLLVVLLLFCAYGCGFENIIKDDEYFDAYVAQNQRRLDSLNKYIGMSKEQIVASLGKPTYIDYNEEFDFYDKATNKLKTRFADEIWSYEYHKGVKYISGSMWHVIYYFKDGKVIYIDIM